MPSEATDQALIARSRDGDTDAFRALFERKHRRVYLIAYQVLGDQARSEDVVQEVFLRLWQHCAKYDESLPLDAWLRRIASNRAIDHWRARRTEHKRRVSARVDTDPDAMLEALAPTTSGTDSPEARLEWRQLQAIWDELAGELPPQQRAAFALRHIEGLATADVAQALDCSASTVRSHVAEARRTLQSALRAKYPELVRRA